MNPNTKNCRLCNATFIPEPDNTTDYCYDCLKRSIKPIITKNPHFFVEDETLLNYKKNNKHKSIEDEILKRKFHKKQ